MIHRCEVILTGNSTRITQCANPAAMLYDDGRSTIYFCARHLPTDGEGWIASSSVEQEIYPLDGVTVKGSEIVKATDLRELARDLLARRQVKKDDADFLSSVGIVWEPIKSAHK